MAERKFSAAIKRLEEERDRMWSSEPDDLKKLKTVQGAYYQFAPIRLYAESETRECADYLWHFRMLARDSKQNFEHLKPVLSGMLEYKADKWVRWYKLENTPALMRQAAAAVQDLQTREEMIEFLNGLLHYMNRLNFWLDSIIPWLAISSVYDWVAEGR